jgi:hypothetical protein
MSKDQEKQAVRVANVPAEEFDLAVESENPPTATALAERGTEKRAPKPAPPPGVQDARHLTGLLRELAAFCETPRPSAATARPSSHPTPVGDSQHGFRVFSSRSGNRQRRSQRTINA